MLKYFYRFLKKIVTCKNKEIYLTNVGRDIFWFFKVKELYELYSGNKNDYNTLYAVLDEVRPKTILEIGCGNGRLFDAYKEKDVKEIVGQDISRRALEYAHKRDAGLASLVLRHCVINELDYQENYFDLTVCSRVLQHIPSKEIDENIEKICYISRYVFINELTTEEHQQGNRHQLYYLFVHDCHKKFETNGFSVIKKYCDNVRGVLQYKFLMKKNSY